MTNSELPFSLPWWLTHTRVLAEIQAQACLSQTEFQSSLEKLLIESAHAGTPDPDDPDQEFDADGEAGRLYKANLPVMSSRREVQLYIAAIAQGVQHGLITGAEAKLFLYTAQLALAAFSGQHLEGPEARLLSKAGCK